MEKKAALQFLNTNLKTQLNRIGVIIKNTIIHKKKKMLSSLRHIIELWVVGGASHSG